MGKTEIFAGSFLCEGEKETFTVGYYLVKTVSETDAGKIAQWGIRAEKHTGKKLTGISEIKNITPDYEKILSVVEKLKEYTVTPVSLRDAVINMIAGDVF